MIFIFVVVVMATPARTHPPSLLLKASVELQS